MYELKTKKTAVSAEDFLNTIADVRRRADCFAIADMMRAATGHEPVMWGPSIIGFGPTTYRTASGQENDWFQIGFSPRKQNITLYLSYGFDQAPDLMARLGKYKTGKGCLYFNRLTDIDRPVLAELIGRALNQAPAG